MQRFLQPDVDFSPWSPIAEFPLEVKTNKARSIQASAPEPVNIPKTLSVRQRNSKARVIDESKELNRRSFEETVERKPEEKTSTTRSNFRRRTTAQESATSRFKVSRRVTQDTQSTTPKSRRQFTARSTSDNVLVTTSEIPSSTRASFKRVPFTRGNFRPNPSKAVNGNAPADEENYPEQFKILLKNKEITEESDKTILKKPLKSYRPSSVNKTTKSPIRSASKNGALFSARTRAPRLISTTEVPTSSEAVSVTTKRSLRRPRPTEKTRTNVGSTLQEPPTAKSTPSYATRPSVRQAVEESVNVNTQADANKQIDPPIREYFPRTSGVSWKTELVSIIICKLFFC